MRMQRVHIILLLALAGGCAGSASKPVEYMDDRTAITIGALQEPIELVPTSRETGRHVFGKHVSFGYLGPVEWDRSGSLVYALWVHIAPGNEREITDIRSPGALTLVLDSGSLVLSPTDAPQLGTVAYKPIASWGQTSYFQLTVPILKQIAASEKLYLDVRDAAGQNERFDTTQDTRAIFSDYLQARGITGD